MGAMLRHTILLLRLPRLCALLAIIDIVAIVVAIVVAIIVAIIVAILLVVFAVFLPVSINLFRGIIGLVVVALLI